MNNYRFDDAYENVYIVTEEECKYYFECTYDQAGITVRMSDERKVAK